MSLVTASSLEVGALTSTHYGEFVSDNFNRHDVDDLYMEVSPQAKKVGTPYTFDYRSMYHYSGAPIQMVKGAGLSWTSPHGMKVLDYVILKQDIKSIKVKPDLVDTYQICWADNLLLCNIDKLEIISSHIGKICSMDGYALAFVINTLMDSADWKDICNEGIGNRKELTTWSTSLPACTLELVIPWFFTLEPRSGFPLFKLAESEKITHTASMFNNIANVLQVRQMVDGRWKVIDNIEHQFISSICIISDNTPSFRDPELYGFHSNISPSQIAEINLKSITSNLFVYDFVTIDVHGEHSYGAQVPIEIVTDDGSSGCVTIYWAARNITARNSNDKFNFTTNSNDAKYGYGPLSGGVSHKVGTVQKMTNIPGTMFNKSLVMMHFSCKPPTGYYALPIQYRTAREKVDTVIPMSLPQTVTVTVTEPPELKGISQHVKYDIICRVMTSKIYTFRDGKLIPYN